MPWVSVSAVRVSARETSPPVFRWDVLQVPCLTNIQGLPAGYSHHLLKTGCCVQYKDSRGRWKALESEAAVRLSRAGLYLKEHHPTGGRLSPLLREQHFLLAGSPLIVSSIMGTFY